MPRQAATQNLTPFTGEEGRKRASEAGKKSAAVRAAKKKDAQLAKVKTSYDLNVGLAEITATFQRGTLATSAAATAQYLMALIVSGSVELSGKDLAPLIGQLVDVARLEEGQSTSNAVIAHLSTDVALEKLEALRSEGRTSLLLGERSETGAVTCQEEITHRTPSDDDCTGVPQTGT